MTASSTMQREEDARWPENRRGAALTPGIQQTMSIRLSGAEPEIRTFLAAVRGISDVDGVVELGLDMPMQDDDSSSAGLPDDSPSGSEEVRLHVPNSVAYDYVHGRVEILAAHAGVVVEWLDGG